MWMVALLRDAAAVALYDPKDRLNRTQDGQDARIALVGRARVKSLIFEIVVTSFVDCAEAASCVVPCGQGGATRSPTRGGRNADLRRHLPPAVRKPASARGRQGADVATDQSRVQSLNVRHAPGGDIAAAGRISKPFCRHAS